MLLTEDRHEERLLGVETFLGNVLGKGIDLGERGEISGEDEREVLSVLEFRRLLNRID